MKIVDFNEKKAEKTGEVTVKSLVENLCTALEKGMVESIIFVAKQPDGQIVYGSNSMNQLQQLGLLECGKQLVMNDMYDE